jgi:transposase-like protein
MKGDKTLLEISRQFELHPNLIAQWKKQLIELAAQLFEKAGKDNAEAEAAERKSGQTFIGPERLADRT